MKRLLTKQGVKKGFTLLEIIIALAIMAIISVLIFPFFSSNYRSLNSTTSKSQLQHEASLVNSLLSQSLMEVKKLESIENSDSKDLLKTTGITRPNYIKYSTGEDQKYSLIIDGKGITKTRLSGDKQSSIEAAIESLTIEPIDSDTSYSDTKGIKVVLTVSNKTESYTTENVIYFRNKK